MIMIYRKFFPCDFDIAKGWLAYDAIGVLSMLTSMNGSGSGDPELRRVCRDRGGVFLVFDFSFPG